MNRTTIINGKHFTVKRESTSPFVWSVYDSKGRYVETFGGSEQAARVHLSTLDMRAEGRWAA